MKKISILLLMFQVNLIMAGDLPNVVIEPENPTASQNIDVIVLGGDCSGPTNPPEYDVDIQGSNIKVFVRFVFGTICGDPPPPPQARYRHGGVINGLAEGDYNLAYYVVSETDDLPPLPADQQSFLVEEIQFEVRGSATPASVNTSSFIGMMTMIVLMLSIGYISVIKNK